MQQPIAWWQPIFDWLRDNTIVFASFALAWKGIDKAFKYYSDSRDAELRKIVQEEMHQPISELSSQIKELSTQIKEHNKAIWDMKKP